MLHVYSLFSDLWVSGVCAVMSVIYFGKFLSIVTSNISSALFFPSASGFEIIPWKIFQCLNVLFFKLFLSSNFSSDVFSSLLSLSSVVLSLLMSSSKGFFTCIVLFLLLRVVFFFSAIFSECLVSLVDSSLLSAYIIHLVVYFSILYYIKYSYFKFLIW